MKNLLTNALYLLLTGFIFAQDNPSAHCDSLLTVFYPFSDNTEDLSGHHHHGTAQGLAQFRNALQVPRDIESAVIVPSESINGAIDFSLTFRVFFDEFNRDTTINGWVPLNSMVSGWSRNNAFNFAYMARAKKVYAAFDGEQFTFELESELFENRWYCMAVTRQDTILKVYVDGRQVSEDVGVPNNPVQLDVNGFVLGQDQDCLAGCYERNHSLGGRLDNFRVYRRALTVYEVANLCRRFVIDVTICEGESYEGYTRTGLYQDNFINSSGCDSIRLVDLRVLAPVITYEVITICAGEAYSGYTAPGIYLDTLAARSGCDSIRTLELTVLEPLRTRQLEHICFGESYAGYTRTGIYRDTLVSSTGCDSIRTLELLVDSVYIPNAFSPNGDGINDYFRIYSRNQNLHIKTLQIYQRWGTKIYERNDFSADPLAAGWNGYYRGAPLEAGVFIYYIELACRDRSVPLWGDLTLMK